MIKPRPSCHQNSTGLLTLHAALWHSLAFFQDTRCGVIMAAMNGYGQYQCIAGPKCNNLLDHHIMVTEGKWHHVEYTTPCCCILTVWMSLAHSTEQVAATSVCQFLVLLLHLTRRRPQTLRMRSVVRLWRQSSPMPGRSCIATTRHMTSWRRSSRYTLLCRPSDC